MQYDTYAALRDLRDQLDQSKDELIGRVRILRRVKIIVGPLLATRRLRIAIVMDIEPENSFQNITKRAAKKIKEIVWSAGRPIILVAIDEPGDVMAFPGCYRDGAYYIGDVPLVYSNLGNPDALGKVVRSLTSWGNTP
jgi:hypothetical protein